jgi:hypothetical protein
MEVGWGKEGIEFKIKHANFEISVGKRCIVVLGLVGINLINFNSLFSEYDPDTWSPVEITPMRAVSVPLPSSPPAILRDLVVPGPLPSLKPNPARRALKFPAGNPAAKNGGLCTNIAKGIYTIFLL